MYCSNCGHEIKKGDLFCENCGTKIEAKPEAAAQETPVAAAAEAVKEKTAEVQKEIKKGNKSVIIIVAVVALLVIAGIVIAATSLFGGSADVSDTAIYYKDNNFYMVTGDDETGTLITEDILDDRDSYLYLGNSYIKMSAEKDGFYYISNISGETGTLLYRSLKDIQKEENAEGTHIASNVNLYGWFIAGDGIVFQKDNGNYYFYSVAEEKETKLLSEVDTCRRSGDRLLFINYDRDLYLAELNDLENIEKIESAGEEYVELVDYTADFETIWFSKGEYGERSLYQKNYGEEKIKLGDGAEYYMTGEKDGEIIIYALKISDEITRTYYDYINDDMIQDDEMALASDNDYAYYTALARERLREELMDSEITTDVHELYAYVDGVETLIAEDVSNINEFQEGIYFSQNERNEVEKVGNISDFYVSFYDGWWSVDLEYWDAYYEISDLIWESQEVQSSNMMICVDGVTVHELPVDNDEDSYIEGFWMTDDLIYMSVYDYDNGDTELFMMDFDGKTIGAPVTVDEDFYSIARVIDEDNAIYYFTDMNDGEGELHYFDGTDSVLIDYDVTSYMSIDIEDDGTILYHKDYNGEDGTTTLYYYNGTEGKQVAYDVYDAERAGDYIYYIGNYNTDRYLGDLFRYSLNDEEALKIDFDVKSYFVIY